MDISVRITREENAQYFGVSVGDVVKVPFEQYVAAVVASEVGNALLAACEAQAVASRTFAVSKGVLDGKTISDSSSSDQSYRAGRLSSGLYPNAEEGTRKTAGEILTYNGKPINAVYSACNGGHTVSSQERWGGVRPYLPSQDDPWDDSTKRTGHGVGMSQRGAKAMAKAGKTYKEILAFYYPGTEIQTIEDEGGDRMVSVKDFLSQVWIPLLQGWGYIYGEWGVLWTQALQDKMNKTTEEKYKLSRLYGAKWIGKWVTDCSGLIFRAMMQFSVKTSHQARYLYTDWCKNKGRMTDGKPEDGHTILPGTCVFLKGSKEHIHHCGVYVGHGICIEAKGVQAGVVTSELNHWDYWGELKVVDYTNASRLEDEPIPEIPKEETVKAEVDNPGKWLNVRSGPGTSYPVQFRLDKGTVVDILAQSDGWCQIRSNGRVGWASAEYLKLLEPEEPEQPVPEDPDIEIINELVSIRNRIDGIIDKLGGYVG